MSLDPTKCATVLALWSASFVVWLAFVWSITNPVPAWVFAPLMAAVVALSCVWAYVACEVRQ